MEKLKVKHDHTLTDILKVLIFTLMLLLPGICFIPNAFYYGFNEHATNTETTTINYKYQSNEVNSLDDLVADNIYSLSRWNFADFSFGNTLHNEGYISFLVLSYESFNIPSNITENLYIDELLTEPYLNNENNFLTITFDSTYFGFAFSNGDAYVNVVYDTDVLNYSGAIQLINAVIQIDQYFIKYVQDFEPNLLNTNYFKLEYTDYNVIESVEINTNDTISNKMYQAWQDLWQTPLLNWTNTTPFNTGLNNFVGVFGIQQNSYIANCLIYILTITAIYVVFDIILSMFKWLTHLIGAK